MNEVKLSDLNRLAHYDFIENGYNRKNNRLLGLKWIKEGNKWRQELVELNKQDVSCWRLFLSFFGIGKLKHTSVALNKICAYLSQYRWKEIKAEALQNPDSSNCKAFKTVCQLANRQMGKHRFNLFKEVSDPIKSDFNHYWNLAMNGRFLLSLQSYRLPDAKNLEIRFKESKISVLAEKTLTKVDLVNIEVGFDLEKVWVGDDCYYHYPHPPYYAFSKPKIEFRKENAFAYLKNLLFNALDRSRSPLRRKI